MNTRSINTIIIDGNNVLGARPDGWWRDRVGAARRLAARIACLASATPEEWTIVFDGRPPTPPIRHAALRVLHSGSGRRNSADYCILGLAHRAADPGALLVYTSDRELRSHLQDLGVAVRGARALLDRLREPG